MDLDGAGQVSARERGMVGSSLFADSEERYECQETQEQELVAIRLGETVT